MTSQESFAELMEQVFQECRDLRQAGQAEYAHDPNNCLANFERGAESLGITREQVLMILFLKHVDGIKAWVQGHRSQRESVKGRINDAIVYLTLLRAMVEDDSQGSATVKNVVPDGWRGLNVGEIVSPYDATSAGQRWPGEAMYKPVFHVTPHRTGTTVAVNEAECPAPRFIRCVEEDEK